MITLQLQQVTQREIIEIVVRAAGVHILMNSLLKVQTVESDQCDYWLGYHNQLKRSVSRSVVYAFKEFPNKWKSKFSSKSETIGTKAAAFWQIIIEYLDFLVFN